jgi:hypothetical protein
MSKHRPRQPHKPKKKTPTPPKKRKVVPKLVSSHRPKTKTAGTILFMSGIARTRTSRVVDCAESEKSAKPSLKTIQIRKPTKEDYENVPDTYVLGRPLLTWEKLNQIPSLIKRLHDWYMRAASVGIDALSVCIPPRAFMNGRSRAMVTLEDMHLMMNIKRLDVQLITVWVL